MKKMTLLRSGLILFSISAAGWAYDAVSLVQSPLMNRPAIVRPGEPFRIDVKSNASSWTASLSMPYQTNVPLQVTAGSLSGGIRTLTATVPANTPSELYDLTVRSSDGDMDAVRHAVKVIREFRDEFTIIHLPDCHLPSVAWIGFYDDPNTVPEFEQVRKEINLIHPEFVLQTGDLIDNGQNESQYRLAQELLADFEVPVFVTGGNHDLWYNGHDFWHRYFGETMDYDFVYNDIRFLALEMYDTPSKTYTADQMRWLRGRLDASISAGEKSRILFTHYDESRQLTGDFVDQHLVDAILYGHTHINGVQMLGVRKALKLNTSYTMNDNGEYRILKIRNGRIESHPVVRYRALWVHISPANDGTSWKVQADIHNDLRDKSTGRGVDLERVLVKLHVKRSAGPFTVTGGTEVQHIDYGADKRVYYIETDVAALSSQTIYVSGAPGRMPPQIATFSPHYDTTLYGGATLPFQIQMQNNGAPAPEIAWFIDDQPVIGQTGLNLTYQAPLNVEDAVTVRVEAEANGLKDVQSWRVFVARSTGRPVLREIAQRHFFSSDQPAVIEWIEPIPGNSVFEYGLRPGKTTGQIAENGANQALFTPEAEGMGLGVYYGRIRMDQGLTSDEFNLVIESPKAPVMIRPLGHVPSLSPVFQWAPVQGVPYYFVILTDHEVRIVKDPVTGDLSVEGANPIWGVLTSETTVPYGAPDPSGTFTSFPAPLAPGRAYWWLVLNCYGNTPELTSTVQSGVSRFTVDLPLPDITPPVLIGPDHLVTLRDPVIRFTWESVENVTGYHFYPFKVEIEEGVEVVRPVWQDVLMTTNRVYEYDAAHQFVKGDYIWKVAAVDKNGVEASSESRRFTYDAPAASVSFKTYDARGTAVITDDVPLARVAISCDAISGVDMGLPLSTDRSGSRPNVYFTPGVYAFTATREGYAPVRDTLSLADGQSVTAAFRLFADPSLINGVVQDQTGEPVAAAVVKLRHSLHQGLTRETRTSVNGEFSVSVLPGPWLLTATKTGYTSGDALAVTVPTDAVADLDDPVILNKQGNTLSGCVVNSAGLPMYGVSVVLQNGSMIASQFTTAEGRFTFIAGDGDWTLSASKTGFVSPGPRRISLSGGQVVEVNPALMLRRFGTLISGRVTDGTHAIADAGVTAVPRSGDPMTGLSDRFGNFALSLDPGDYSLEASMEGYGAGNTVTVTLKPDETVAGVILALRPHVGLVSGSVTLDGVTPLEGATVSVGDARVTTTGGGFYSIGTPAGIFEVGAEKTGYLGDPPRPVMISSGQRITGMNFVLLPHAGVVAGVVVEKTTGRPLPDAKVFADNGYHAASVAGTDGRYTLNVPGGRYNIHASLINYASDTLTVPVGEVQEVRNLQLTMTQFAAMLSGVIRDAATQNGLMGVMVELPETGLTTVTRADGSYNLRVPPATGGGHAVWFMKTGYETIRLLTGALNHGQTRSFNRSLTRFKSYLEGQIVDEYGVSVDDAVLTASAAAGNGTYLSRSRPDGRYALYLPSAGGAFTIRIEKPGYLFSRAGTTVTVSPESRVTRNFTLNTHFAGLTGKVFDAALGQAQSAIPNATLFWQQDDQIIATLTSDDLGFYHFADGNGRPFLVEGSYHLRVEKSHYADTLVQNLVLTGGRTATQDIGLRKYTSMLSGTVTDGSAGLAEVSLTIQHFATGQRYSRISDANGVFRFETIPAGNFRLRGSLAGYTSTGVLQVTAPSTTLDIVLSKNIGRIRGVIRDLQTQKPLSGATIIMKDGHGNEAVARSDALGAYDATQLFSGFPYTVTASLYGYVPVSRTNISPTLTTPTDFSLQRITGSIRGRVTDAGTGSAVVAANVRIQSESGLSKQTIQTHASGAFFVSDLASDVYFILAEQPGFLSDPASRRINLARGGDSTNIDFVLEAVTLADLSITGPATMPAGRPSRYAYTARTEDGRSMMIQPDWSVDIPFAAESLTRAGELTIKSDFIGPIQLTLTDLYSGLQDSMTVEVTHQINPGNPRKQFKDYQGASFVLPENCVIQPLSLGLKHPDVPKIKRLMQAYELTGDLYALTPNGLTLNHAMTLTLPVSDPDAGDPRLGEWDSKALKWLVRDATAQGAALTFQSAVLSQWAVFAPSEALGIRELRLESNPFSPFIGPLDISFKPTTRASTHLTVTINIHNMIGDRVRELEVNKMISKGGRVHFTWDGRTDSGDMALNGRYLVHIHMRDGHDDASVLKPVVLIK